MIKDFDDKGLWIIFWMAFIALLIVLPTATERLKFNKTYHDECIESHNEYNNSALDSVGVGVITARTFTATCSRLNVSCSWDDWFYVRDDIESQQLEVLERASKITVCDKYALVRNVK